MAKPDQSKNPEKPAHTPVTDQHDQNHLIHKKDLNHNFLADLPEVTGAGKANDRSVNFKRQIKKEDYNQHLETAVHKSKDLDKITDSKLKHETELAVRNEFELARQSAKKVDQNAQLTVLLDQKANEEGSRLIQKYGLPALSEAGQPGKLSVASIEKREQSATLEQRQELERLKEIVANRVEAIDKHNAPGKVAILYSDFLIKQGDQKKADEVLTEARKLYPNEPIFGAPVGAGSSEAKIAGSLAHAQSVEVPPETSAKIEGFIITADQNPFNLSKSAEQKATANDVAGARVDYEKAIKLAGDLYTPETVQNALKAIEQSNKTASEKEDLRQGWLSLAGSQGTISAEYAQYLKFQGSQKQGAEKDALDQESDKYLKLAQDKALDYPRSLQTQAAQKQGPEKDALLKTSKDYLHTLSENSPELVTEIKFVPESQDKQPDGAFKTTPAHYEASPTAEFKQMVNLAEEGGHRSFSTEEVIARMRLHADLANQSVKDPSNMLHELDLTVALSNHIQPSEREEARQEEQRLSKLISDEKTKGEGNYDEAKLLRLDALRLAERQKVTGGGMARYSRAMMALATEDRETARPLIAQIEKDYPEVADALKNAKDEKTGKSIWENMQLAAVEPSYFSKFCGGAKWVFKEATCWAASVVAGAGAGVVTGVLTIECTPPVAVAAGVGAGFTAGAAAGSFVRHLWGDEITPLDVVCNGVDGISGGLAGSVLGKGTRVAATLFKGTQGIKYAEAAVMAAQTTTEGVEVADVTSKVVQGVDATTKVVDVADISAKGAHAADATQAVQAVDATTKVAHGVDATAKLTEGAEVSNKALQATNVTSKLAQFTGKVSQVASAANKSLKSLNELREMQKLLSTGMKAEAQSSGIGWMSRFTGHGATEAYKTMARTKTAIGLTRGGIDTAAMATVSFGHHTAWEMRNPDNYNKAANGSDKFDYSKYTSSVFQKTGSDTLRALPMGVYYNSFGLGLLTSGTLNTGRAYFTGPKDRVIENAVTSTVADALMFGKYGIAPKLATHFIDWQLPAASGLSRLIDMSYVVGAVPLRNDYNWEAETGLQAPDPQDTPQSSGDQTPPTPASKAAPDLTPVLTPEQEAAKRRSELAPDTDVSPAPKATPTPEKQTPQVQQPQQTPTPENQSPQVQQPQQTPTPENQSPKVVPPQQTPTPPSDDDDTGPNYQPVITH